MRLMSSLPAALLLVLALIPSAPPTLAPEDPVGEWSCVGYAQGPRIQVTREANGALHARYVDHAGTGAQLMKIGPHRYQWTDASNDASIVSTFEIANNALHLTRAINTSMGSRAGSEVYLRTSETSPSPTPIVIRHAGHNIIIGFSTHLAGPFKAAVLLGDYRVAAGTAGGYRIYNWKGERVGPDLWKMVKPVVPGRWAAKRPDGQWQLIDMTGSPITHAAWLGIEVQQRRLVGLRDSHWFDLDFDGNSVASRRSAWGRQRR
jgi:hypothetical protein